MNPATDTEPPYVHDLTPAQLVALQANAAARLDCGIAFRDALDDGTRGPELRLIPAGVFEMGAKPEDRGFGEQLPRRVEIDRPFALGRFCVTAEEFGVFARETGFVWTDHLVLAEGRPVGRLYVHRRPAEIRLMDVALLPEARGRGLGTILLRRLMDEAECEKKRLTIHVEIFNPARRLYDRLGFVPVEDRGVYQLLQWSPSSGIPGGIES